MKKLFLISALAVLVTGCASSGDLDAVTGRVSKLEAHDTAIVKEVTEVEGKVSILSQQQEQCLNHCKLLDGKFNDYNTKLNSLFDKAMLK
jgi:peptidoglycan hydrolase CwlO-like protein